MIAIVRTVAMVLVSAFAGSYLSTETDSVENYDTTQTGVSGWWVRQPVVVKAAAVIGVAAAGVAVFNWAKHGNWKGSGAGRR